MEATTSPKINTKDVKNRIDKLLKILTDEFHNRELIIHQEAENPDIIQLEFSDESDITINTDNRTVTVNGKNEPLDNNIQVMLQTAIDNKGEDELRDGDDYKVLVSSIYADNIIYNDDANDNTNDGANDDTNDDANDDANDESTLHFIKMTKSLVDINIRTYELSEQTKNAKFSPLSPHDILKLNKVIENFRGMMKAGGRRRHSKKNRRHVKKRTFKRRSSKYIKR